MAAGVFWRVRRGVVRTWLRCRVIFEEVQRYKVTAFRIVTDFDC